MRVQPLADQEGFVTSTREYVVLELDISATRSDAPLMFRIIDDGGRPLLMASSDFRVIDGNLPGSWHLHMESTTTAVLGPRSWQRPAFWDDFFAAEGARREASLAARADFVRELHPMGVDASQAENPAPPE